jgi:hypothetical protein
MRQWGPEWKYFYTLYLQQICSTQRFEHLQALLTRMLIPLCKVPCLSVRDTLKTSHLNLNLGQVRPNNAQLVDS